MTRGNGLRAVAVLITLAACSGKHRPFADGVGGSDGMDNSLSSQGGSPRDGMTGATTPGVEGEEGVSCNGEETCIDMLVTASEAVSCPGCLVEGECLAAGELNPDNSCQVCAPALDASAWSPNDGAACDDGLYCTTEDVCDAGACVGAQRKCDDAIACNGVTVCLEEEDACSRSENQCDNEALCDIATGDCVSTCEGCTVDGSCLAPGTTAVGTPCLVCDPARSTTSLSAAEGQPCGSSATECSAQDTCNAQGECEPNDRESGAPCGAAVVNDCDATDACDGNGQCVARRADNGTGCEDGLFCTVSDQCQGSTCVGGGPRSCGSNERCNEEAGRCVCAGCSVNGNCVAAGALNPANSCQICDPARSSSAYSANVGANCGSAATACSGQDTCNAQAQCAPNHLPAGTACGAPGGDQCDAGDSCDGSGQCAQRVAQNGDPCDDGLFCSNGDACQSGACRSGAPRNCGANQTCDEATNQCRCNGCVINGNCVAAGAVNPANSCQICNPAQSTVGFVGNVGANCGAAASACSGQDTCNAQGQCQPNHVPQGTVCGTPASGQCDATDTCNGGGQCISRQAADGTACEDGAFCTLGDRCQSGGCVAGGGACGNRPCDEAANRCGVEDGQPCTVNSDCLSVACRFPDNDGDTFGSSSGGLCGSNRPGFVATGGDCCDVAGNQVAAQINPGQEGFFGDAQTVCRNVRPFDYDCSNQEERDPQFRDSITCSNIPTDECGGFTWSGTPPACGGTGDIEFCGMSDPPGTCTVLFVVTEVTEMFCH